MKKLLELLYNIDSEKEDRINELNKELRKRNEQSIKSDKDIKESNEYFKINEGSDLDVRRMKENKEEMLKRKEELKKLERQRDDIEEIRDEIKNCNRNIISDKERENLSNKLKMMKKLIYQDQRRVEIELDKIIVLIEKL